MWLHSFLASVKMMTTGSRVGVCRWKATEYLYFLFFFFFFFFWPYTSWVAQARASWKCFWVLFLSILLSLHSFVFSSNAGSITLETAAELKKWTHCTPPPPPPPPHFLLLHHPVSPPPPPPPRHRHFPSTLTGNKVWGLGYKDYMQTTQQAKGTNNALQTSHVKHTGHYNRTTRDHSHLAYE